MSKLLLIDGNAILHRAYHAYPPVFTDKEGHPVNAVYGFFAMLLKLLEDQHPDFLAICFDRHAPTFRQELFAGYQQGRPAMQDDLVIQVPILQKSLEDVGIPLFGIDGYEADDLLGSLSVLAKKEGLETVIVTGDRDLLQLVNSHVKILMPLTGITKTALYGEKEVEEKYGVKPSQFIDYKALVGDASDGYPGVTGIGPKGAANLLQKYGSFEKLYKHISELPMQVQEKLATDAEQAALAKKLATIAKDAPVHLDLKKCDVKHFQTEKFVKVFEDLGFKSLVRRLEESKGTKETKVEMKKVQEKNKSDTEQLGLL